MINWFKDMEAESRTLWIFTIIFAIYGGIWGILYIFETYPATHYIDLMLIIPAVFIGGLIIGGIIGVIIGLLVVILFYGFDSFS